VSKDLFTLAKAAKDEENKAAMARQMKEQRYRAYMQSLEEHIGRQLRDFVGNAKKHALAPDRSYVRTVEQKTIFGVKEKKEKARDCWEVARDYGSDYTASYYIVEDNIFLKWDEITLNECAVAVCKWIPHQCYSLGSDHENKDYQQFLYKAKKNLDPGSDHDRADIEFAKEIIDAYFVSLLTKTGFGAILRQLADSTISGAPV
jgi:hypothetical protein